jgi:hypothetical protein
VSARLFGGEGVTVDSVPELGAAQASRAAAANPMMWENFMACFLSLSGVTRPGCKASPTKVG